MGLSLPGVLGNAGSGLTINASSALESATSKLNSASTLSNDISKVASSVNIPSADGLTSQASGFASSIGMKLGSAVPASLGSGLTAAGIGGGNGLNPSSLGDAVGLKVGMSTESLALSTALEKSGDVAVPSFSKIGSPYNLAFVDQVGGDFSHMADRVSLQASKLDDSANYSLVNPTNIPDASKMLDGVSSGNTSGLLDKALTSVKGGATMLTDAAKAPFGLLDSAKSMLTGGSASLKNAFSQLPQGLQNGLLSSSGSLLSNGLGGAAQGIMGQVGGFIDKVTSGQYVLNPASFKQDLKNLTSFSTMAATAGFGSSILKMATSTGLSAGPMGKIATSVGFGMLATKNGDALKTIGISAYGNSDILSMGSAKTSFVDTIFSSLKKKPVKPVEKKTLYTDLQTAQTGLAPPTPAAAGSSIYDLSSMVKANPNSLSAINYVKTDNSVLPVKGALSDSAYTAAQVDAMNRVTITSTAPEDVAKEKDTLTAAAASMANVDSGSIPLDPLTAQYG